MRETADISAKISAIAVIDLADMLRANAQACGADLNAANLFVHEVLMRAIASGVRFENLAIDDRCERHAA